MELSFDSVLLVGDTHASVSWLRGVVLPAAAELGVDSCVVLGDFGYWPEAGEFLKVARDAQKTHGVLVSFIDGNHEDHALLRTDCLRAGEGLAGPVWLGGGLNYLPRGSTISVGGLSVLCVGGAASIDRSDRVESISWFAEETLSRGDVVNIRKVGEVDVVLSHDAPSGWDIPGLPSLRLFPQGWLDELAHCRRHRRILAEALAKTNPQLLVHGHYHSNYQKTVNWGIGSTTVQGLSKNNTAGWGAVLSARNGRPVLEGELGPLLATVPYAEHEESRYDLTSERVYG